MRLALSLLFVLFMMPLAAAADDPQPLSEVYRQRAGQLTGAALSSKEGYARLQYLCDRIGNRVSGSPSLEKAVQWGAGQMRAAGLDNVRMLPVKVPHWVRGEESAAITSPIQRQLPMLGLGNSVGTGSPITAEVVAVNDWAQLDALGEAVRGKIVLFNVPYEGYGKTVGYRISAPSRAAKYGAVAILLRSVGSATLQTPHTGVTQYADGVAKIPGAAITIEDAQLIARLLESGDKVTVRLSMAARMETDADSFNVIGEIPGSELPNEVVAVGGHIDSWDVGQGAQDDGAGIMASLEAVALIKKLGLKPRRTLRVVFWTNEENGAKGAAAYAEWAKQSGQRHVAAIEMDGGSERPSGFSYSLSPTAKNSAAVTAELGKLLQGIEADKLTPAPESGTDIAPLVDSGVAGFGLLTSGGHYFDWHHTQADTVDKIKPAEFRLNVAALAILGYVLADMPGTLTEK